MTIRAGTAGARATRRPAWGAAAATASSATLSACSSISSTRTIFARPSPPSVRMTAPEEAAMGDPLDEKSDVYVERKIDGKTVLVELTFRELQKECLLGSGHMALLDSLKSDTRLKHELANDPNYKPIAPGEGQRRHRVRPVHKWWRHG